MYFWLAWRLSSKVVRGRQEVVCNIAAGWWVSALDWVVGCNNRVKGGVFKRWSELSRKLFECSRISWVDGGDWTLERLALAKEYHKLRNEQWCHCIPLESGVNHELCWLGHGGIGRCQKTPVESSGNCDFESQPRSSRDDVCDLTKSHFLANINSNQLSIPSPSFPFFYPI